MPARAQRAVTIGAGSAALLLSLLIAVAQPGHAHVPQLRGRLADLVGQSDLVIVGTVEQASTVAGKTKRTTARVDEVLIGAPPGPSLTFEGPARFPAGRFVFFLRRDGAGFDCVQPSGTPFPASAPDDALYRQTITGVKDALRGPEDVRVAALRAALIPALSASAPALRTHAALELANLAHHPVTQSERESLERIAADPTTDPGIRSVAETLLRAAR